MILIIKRMVKYVLISFERLFYYKFIIIKYLFKGTIIRKPLNIHLAKYLTIEKDVAIDSFCRLECYKVDGEKKPKLEICEKTRIGFNFTALCASYLHIGKNVLIASHVFISTENHGSNPELGDYNKQKLETKDIFIDDFCWIGEKVCILPGVTIGKHSIIGANSVVTKSIPEYSIAVGNPAKVIKKYNFEKHAWEEI